MKMTTSKDMIDQITRFEGCRLRAYKDYAGIWTIGVGHTGKEVKAGMTITVDEAKSLLREDIATAERAVNALNTILDNQLLQCQFDALVSLVYNCGVSAIREGTTMRNALTKRGIYGYASICRAFMLWVKAKNPRTGRKEVVKGLQIRRATEYAWYVYGKNFAEELSNRRITDLIAWATT